MSGSQEQMSSAPVAFARSASASRSSTAPRKFGCWRNTALVSSSMAAASASMSVTPSRRPTSCDRRAVARGHRGQRLARVRVHAPGDHEPRAPVLQPRQVAGGGQGARALVDRGVGDRQPGELGDRGLVLEHHLEPALGDLGLVGRVGRQELRAGDDRVDQRRHVVVVHPGAEEGQLVLGGHVARRRGRAAPRRPRPRACRRAGRARAPGAPRRGCRRTAPRWTQRRSPRASPGGRRRWRTCSGSCAP